MAQRSRNRYWLHLIGCTSLAAPHCLHRGEPCGLVLDALTGVLREYLGQPNSYLVCHNIFHERKIVRKEYETHRPDDLDFFNECLEKQGALKSLNLVRSIAQRREDSRIYICLEDVRSDLPGDGHRYLMYHLAVHLPSASTVILPAFMTVSAPRRDLLRRGFV